jgi:hypothetical protein
MKFILILIIAGIVISVAVALFVAYAALMVMFIACVAVWGVWAALLGFILSGLIENTYDAMIFGAVLAIPAALLTFAWFNREKHAGGTEHSDKAARN